MPVAARLAAFYAAAFLLVGIQLPFWPIFLAGRGLSAGEIGFVLAAALWIKVLVNPLAGLLADRSGRRRGVMILLAAINLAGFLLFLPIDGLWPLLLVNALTTTAASSLLPLGETLALGIVYAKQLDYGRIRLWGSVSFILGALGAGAFVTAAASEVVLTLLIGAAALNVLACLQLPAPVAAPRGIVRADWRRLLLDRRQLLFLAAATAIQASHSVYYGFGTLHWYALGYSSQTIGWLWAEGVVAEIALFAAGARLLARLGPARLLVLAGGAGVLRWGLMAGTPSPSAPPISAPCISWRAPCRRVGRRPASRSTRRPSRGSVSAWSWRSRASSTAHSAPAPISSWRRSPGSAPSPELSSVGRGTASVLPAEQSGAASATDC